MPHYTGSILRSFRLALWLRWEEFFILYLEALNIEKYYGDRLILEMERLTIDQGDRIGIVGRNGAGKTTLLDILSGILEPDGGLVKRYAPVTYIRQFGGEVDNADPRLTSEFRVQDKTESPAVSGGEATRLKLADAFSREQVLLFADEPTSNLDMDGITLLKEKLASYDSLVLVSHDKSVLNTFCNRILEVKDGKVRSFAGNYDSYREQTNLDRKEQQVAYEKYIQERQHLETALQDKYQSSAKSLKNRKKKPPRYSDLKMEHSQKKSDNAVKQLKTRLDQLEVVEKPQEEQKIQMDFSLTDPPQNKIVLMANRLTFAYPEKPTLFDKASFEIHRGAKVALVGPNGVGKSTLLNLIAGRYPGIRAVPKAKLGYYKQDFSHLEENKTILENVMAESIQPESTARTMLSRLGFRRETVFKKVEILSGGERGKIALARLLVSNVNVLLLDEPTNFLDIYALEAVESLIRQYEGTVLFVSHDASFVETVATETLRIENKKILPPPPPTAKAASASRLVLEMRLADLATKISSAQKEADKEALEAQYAATLERIRAL